MQSGPCSDVIPQLVLVFPVFAAICVVVDHGRLDLTLCIEKAQVQGQLIQLHSSSERGRGFVSQLAWFYSVDVDHLLELGVSIAFLWCIEGL